MSVAPCTDQQVQLYGVCQAAWAPAPSMQQSGQVSGHQAGVCQGSTWAPVASMQPSRQVSGLDRLAPAHAGHMQVLHGPNASAPNLVCLQQQQVMAAHNYCLSKTVGVRSNSYSGASAQGGTVAGLAGHMGLQLQQVPGMVPIVPSAASTPAVSTGPGMRSAQADQQLMLELASALAMQAGDPSTPNSRGSLQAMLTAAGGMDSAQGKLQLLQQLQVLIAQQQQQRQQQLQQQLQAQHANPLARSASTNPTFGACAGAGAGAVAVPARLSVPGCLGATVVQDDTAIFRDQLRPLPRSSGTGYLQPMFAGGNRMLQIQMQQQQAQQEVLSPCAFNNTPTALAALPPSLLAEVVGVDAAASVILQAEASTTCRLSSSSSSGNSASDVVVNSTTSTGPGAAAAVFGVSTGMGNGLARVSAPGSSLPPTRAIGSGRAGGSSATLQQQLQQAIDQLASLQVSSNAAAGSSGPLSMPLSSSKGWDWGSVGELLRSDSSASQASSGINRSSSNIASEASTNGNIWADPGAHHGGMLPGCGGSLVAEGSGLCPAVQRSTSIASCVSAASASAAPAHKAGATSQTASRSSCSGILPRAAAGSVTVLSAPPLAPALAECAKPAGGIGKHATGTSADSATGNKRVSGSGQCNKQGPKAQEQAASLDSLLRTCAPRWAKQGWDPKASVATTPAKAKGTGGFVKLASAPQGTPPASEGCKGSGVFIPPAVRAAVAAAAGLGLHAPKAGSR